MLRKLLVAFTLPLLITFVLKANVPVATVVPFHQPRINQDTLANILQQKDDFLRQKRLVLFIKNYIQASELSKLSAVKRYFQSGFYKVFDG
jgi:hypothetical protein